MSFGFEEARIRLDYINQHREVTLGAYLATAMVSRVLGLPIPYPILAGLLLWFALSIALARLARRARTETWLHRCVFSCFLAELALLTFLAHCCGGASWLGAMFFTVTILYANLVLPRRQGMWITALAAASFTGLVLLEYFHLLPHDTLFASGARFDSVHFVIATLLVGAAAGFWIIGYTSAQFSRMLQGKAEALAAANRELKQTGDDLRLHQDHLEELVRQRTGDLGRAYEELWEAHRELQRLNELKSNFLANVSHELRTPLTSIRSFSEILYNYPDEKVETRAEFLEIIISESERLTRLINDVLDLAKIEAGRMQWRIGPVQLAGVAAQSLEVVRVVAEKKGLRLLNVVESGLPPFQGDADRIQQVFTNLLANAVKFTAHGYVLVGSLRRPAETLIFVRDSGPGIAGAELSRIFDKFHQHGNSYTEKPPGTGLGLSICREIMQHLGGRIWAESELSRGTTIFCSFPESPAGAEVDAATPAERRAALTAADAACGAPAYPRPAVPTPTGRE